MGSFLAGLLLLAHAYLCVLGCAGALVLIGRLRTLSRAQRASLVGVRR